MPCRELRFCLWYFMWSTKIRKTVFVQKVAEIKRKHPKSEDFRCCSGSAGQIRTADLILTKKFAFILPCVRLCLYIPSGLCAIRIFVLSSLSPFYLILGRLLEDLLEILFRILHQNRIPYGVLLQSRPTHLPNTHTSVK